jgi:hypothetical protein
MSAKWIRSKEWDDRNIPRWAWPVKALLRTFSSIWFGVAMLVLVALYGALASIPAGVIALLPTLAFDAATFAIPASLITLLPMIALRRVWNPHARAARNLRFVVTILGGLALLVLSLQLWTTLAWPRLQYDPATGRGVRFFADFCRRYNATTIRRLPGMEMSELEFYSWWPLRTVLLLFVTSMIVATVRRIEFTFDRLGVLMVHTGIVTIALGSAYYSGLKREGDTLLLAGEPNEDGTPTAGTPQSRFYDNTRTALWVRQASAESSGWWEQRQIHPPRYNEYNLHAASRGAPTVLDFIGRGNPPDIDGARTLDASVSSLPGVKPSLDPDISLRIVGYATSAESQQDWCEAPAPATGEANPVRFARLESDRDEHGARRDKPVGLSFFFLPRSPADRLGETSAFGIEETRGMSAERWRDLQADIPPGTPHALVVEVPVANGHPAYSGVIPAELNKDVKLGESGYTLRVVQLAPQPPFPLVTPGYKGGQSSLAIVRITTPDGKGFDRWVYHRFPEITQDLLDEKNERGMPKRRDADPAIRVSYIDASKLQVYVDEQPPATPSQEKSEGIPDLASRTRILIRTPGGAARLLPPIGADGVAELFPGLRFSLLGGWAHAEAIETPRLVPLKQGSTPGLHEQAMLAIEVRARDGFSRVVWLPFAKYMGLDATRQRRIELPDGRAIEIAFARLAHELPGFVVQLMDFEMISYEHTNQPRDYQSTLRVVPTHGSAGPSAFEPYTHVAKLNAPLQAPFMWRDDRSWLFNAWGTFVSRLDPNQFKFSQAGWDAEGWNQTLQMVDAKQIPRPFVRFTILGVGNNPGIHIIALGGILMSVGIPWAFYLKPWLVRRKKRRLQLQVAGERHSETLIQAGAGT